MMIYVNMPRSRSRESRRRSLSPGPEAASASGDRRRQADSDRPRRKDGGFRWKDRSGSHRRHEGRPDDDLRRRPERRKDRSRSPRRRPDEPDREAKPAPAPPTMSGGGEAMIIVHVNDRLGTKAAIPCLASDPIRSFAGPPSSDAPSDLTDGGPGLFKAQVAARIGRQPHEILLKRQGERPFKDALTLEDYGVSNGVQLDLYVLLPGCAHVILDLDRRR